MSPSPAMRPGWPEIATGLGTYLVLLVLIVLWITRIPDEQAAYRGIVGMAANGIAGIAGLLAAYTLRIRDLSAFGFRVAGRRWLLAGASLGMLAFGASFVIEHVYFLFVTEANTQGDFQAAAQAGALSLAVLLFAGAILTPLGEEFLFRGVIARALDRYGAWIGIVGSAAIFAIVHGLSVIFLLAFMIGVLAAALLRRTGSIWPGVVVHVIYNGLHLIYYAKL